MQRKVISLIMSFLIFASFFVVETTSIVSASTIIVPDNYPTIQEAINSAGSGDTIYVRAGTYYENLIIKKSLNLLGEDKYTTIIDGCNNGNVIYLEGDDVTITGFTILNSGSSGAPDHDSGIKLYYSYNCNITDNIVSSNRWGINLLYSDNNIIARNDVTSNNQHGLYIWSSSYNIIIENNASSNNFTGIRLHGHYCHDNLVSDNVVSDNDEGINLYKESHDNIILNNLVSNNTEGIYLHYSDNNNITDNFISLSSYRGIMIHRGNTNTVIQNTLYKNFYGLAFDTYYSTPGSIYHNDMIDNTNQAWNILGYYQPLDNGYPSGGNYWSDYSGTDNFQGPNQNIPGSDGIGDIPYLFDIDGIDNYPLMNPWSYFIQPTVDIDPDTLNLQSKGRWITCYINLPNGYDVNEINIGTVMLEDTIPAEWGDIQGDTLMVKFDRSEVEDMFPIGTYNMKVTGELADGTLFEGYSDEIRVIDPP